MSVKYFDKEKQEWTIFPGVKGMSAYESAKVGGYTGSKEDFISDLSSIEDIPNKYQETLKEDSKLFTLNGNDIFYNSDITIDSIKGKDGVTPLLKIENGYWEVSYDNGAIWTQLGKATGEDGKDGIDGENGTDGEDGKDGLMGRIAYPDGLYTNDLNSHDYIATSTKAPYVFNKANGKYYIYNKEESWKEYLDQDPIFVDNYPDDLTYPQGWEDYWIEVDNINALYTEIGVIENGTIGDAVFNKGKMFSKDGEYYDGTKFVETSEGDGNYSLFGSYVDQSLNKDYYSENHKFHPNTMIDFDSGKAVFGRGTVKLAESSKDTSVFDSKVDINNQFYAKYYYNNGDDVDATELSVTDRAASIKKRWGQTGEKISLIEIRNEIDKDELKTDPEIYIQAKDPRSDSLISSIVDGVKEDYSRITLQEYINRCIANYLYGNISDSEEILSINNVSISIGAKNPVLNSNNNITLTADGADVSSVSTGYCGWYIPTNPTITYNTQNCSTVVGSNAQWNCKASTKDISDTIIEITRSTLFSSDDTIITSNCANISYSENSYTTLSLNTFDSVTGEVYGWAKAVITALIKDVNSSFSYTITITINNE